MKTSRQLVLQLLIKMAKNTAFSNILLDEALLSSGLSPQDKKFTAALFYGVIERQITLDEIIKKYCNRPIAKLSVEIQQILRMGIYQLLYMDSVPESAAVNESVILAKQNKNPAASGFVNGLLRSFIRDGMEIPTSKNKIEALSLEYSCPQWLISKWMNEYGQAATRTMLETSLGRAPITIKVNTTKLGIDEIIPELEADGISAVRVENIPDCLEIKTGAGVEASSAYKKGYFHVQDISSQLCCMALAPKSDETVLDLCSAPGGKAFTLAEMMNNQGRLLAFDLHENRVQLIWKGAKRLGLSCIKAAVNDAKKLKENMPTADKILCDVPCSGLGVIRRKPEIKYKNPQDFENLPKVQLEILETSASYLKVGGELVYSTCTINKAENDDVIDEFLARHSEFEKAEILPNLRKPFGSYKATIFPDYCNSDGFFIAKVKKVR